MDAISPCFCVQLTNGNISLYYYWEKPLQPSASGHFLCSNNQQLWFGSGKHFTVYMLKCYGSTRCFCSSLYIFMIQIEKWAKPTNFLVPLPHQWNLDPPLCYISHIPFFKATVLTCSFSVQVLPSPSPSLYKDATHLFADFTRLKPGDFRVDVSVASNQGVTCLKPEYIADYLMQVSGWILDWITTFHIMSLLCSCI